MLRVTDGPYRNLTFRDGREEKLNSNGIRERKLIVTGGTLPHPRTGEQLEARMLGMIGKITWVRACMVKEVA